MKTIFKKLIIIIWFFILFLSFFAYQIRPDLSLGEFFESMVVKRQGLPLGKMFVEPKENGFFVSEGISRSVLVGPYQTLPPGLWEINLKITPYCDNVPLGIMDVVKNKGQALLNSKEIIPIKIGQEEVISLEFEDSGSTSYEFRLYSYGRCDFEINDGWLERKRLYLNILFERAILKLKPK